MISWTRSTKTFLIATLFVASARAQDPTAAALFKAGKELMQQGNVKEACPKFEMSYKREEALGTLMNMADCHEKAGLIARAWSEWGTAYDKARKADDTPRADLSKRRQEALEPRLPKMKIAVTGNAPDLAVWRDDRMLDPLEYDIDLPVEPGKHLVSVRRGSEILESREDVAEEKGHVVVPIDLAKIAAAHPAPPPKKDVPVVVAIPEAPKQARPWQAPLGAIVFASGAGIFAVGFGFEGIALGLKGTSGCASKDGDTQLCTPKGLDQISNARIFATVGTAMIIGGAALAVAGAIVWLTAPKAPKAAVVPIPGGVALGWGGTF